MTESQRVTSRMIQDGAVTSIEVRSCRLECHGKDFGISTESNGELWKVIAGMC